MLRNMTKTVKTMVNTETNIITRSRGKWGSSNSPSLAVPRVNMVDKQDIDVTCERDVNKVILKLYYVTN